MTESLPPLSSQSASAWLQRATLLYNCAYYYIFGVVMALRTWALSWLNAFFPGIFRRYVIFDASPRNAVLITGTSSGIGEDLALSLARDGYTVFACVRKSKDGEDLRRAFAYSALESQQRGTHEIKLLFTGLGEIVPVIMDVTKVPTIQSTLAFVQRHLANSDGHLRAIINNAGIASALPVELTTREEMEYVFDVNLFGVAEVTKAFLPLLRESGGRVVIIGSMSGFVAAPSVGAYSASKFALEGWTDALRLELRNQRIPVSLIEPGAPANCFNH
jgi:NAD(P)-dependent dehydrogenase (short-subunit alcohol dehydrogenase family)